jgi:hypothetical protein
LAHRLIAIRLSLQKYFFSPPSNFSLFCVSTHGSMERYAVTFADGEGKETRLLIPFRSSAPVADLTVEIWRRLNRVGINVGKNDLELRLGGVDGPIVFEDDALEHVIFNTKDEQLYVVNKPTISENLKPNMGTATVSH